jgi:hypothetical protein
LGTLNWCLEKSDDEVIKSYVVKTIENISALTQISKIYFTKDERFIVNLISLFNVKNIELKISAVVSVSHLVRLESKLFKSFLDKFGLINLIALAEKESARIQQALVNIILHGIQKDCQIMIKNEFFIPLCNFLIKLIDTPNNVIRIKIFLIFGILFESPLVVSKFGEKIFNHIHRRKDNSQEMNKIIKVFESTIQLKIKLMVKNFISLITKDMSSNEEILLHFNAFITFHVHPKLISTIYNQDLLEVLIKIIESDSIKDETMSKYVLQLISNFSENPKSVLENVDFVLRRMIMQILNMCLK